MKKILAALLAALLLISAFAACGEVAPSSSGTEKQEEAAEPEKEDEAAPAEEASSEGKTKIVIFRCLYNLSVVDDAQVKKVQDAINAALDARGANVEIEIREVASSEYSDKASLALANQEINLLWHASWWGGGIGCDDIWRNKGAYDVTDLLPGTTLYDAMPEGVWEASKYDGRVLFIPVYKETYEGYDMKTTQYAVDATGHDATFPEVAAAEGSFNKIAALGEYLEECKNAGIKYPYLSTQFFYRYGLDYYDFFGGSSSLLAVNRETNEVENAVTSDLYKEWCKLNGTWSDAGYIHEDCIAKAVPNGIAKTQDWGLQFWTNVPGDSKTNSEARDEQPEVMIEGITGWYTHSTTTLGSCYSVTANSTEAEAKACIEWLGYLYTDEEIADLFTFGIEGEDYELVAAKDAEEGAPADRVKKTDSAKYNHAAWESTSVVPLTLLWDEPADKVEGYVKNNEAAQTSIAAGFRFDKTSVDAEWAACSDLNSKYGEPLELGAFSADDVDATLEEYLQELDAAGYQAVFEEAKKQYEEWYAAK